jgi:hypothetical protein
MAKPNSRTTLIDYCFRALGAPVIEINVDDDQVDDRIDEALQFYQHYHADAIEKVFLKHQVTADDITNGYLTVPDLVTDVVQIFPLRESGGHNMFDIQYQMHLNDMYSLGYMGSLVEYEMAQQWLSMLDLIMDSDTKHLSFDRHKNQLRIDMDWSKEVEVDEYIIIECYRILDPTTYTDVYNDYFLKRYATALMKRQWGQNLIKYNNVQLPGGITLNGRQIWEDGDREVRELESRMMTDYSLPPMDMIG